MKGTPPLPNILRLDENAKPVWDSEKKGKDQGYSLGFSYWLIFVSMVSPKLHGVQTATRISFGRLGFGIFHHVIS